MENEDHIELYGNNSRTVFTHLVQIISLVGQWKTQGQVCTIQVLSRDSTFLYPFTRCILGQALSLPSKSPTSFSKGGEGRNAVSFPNNDSRVAKEKVLFQTLSGPLRHSSGEPQ